MFTLSRTLTLYLILALAASAGAGGLYWYVRHQGVVAEREKQRQAELNAYLQAVAKSSKLAQDLEAQLADMRAANLKLTKELSDETNRNPVYRDCRVPANGVRLLQRAVAGASTR